MTNVSGYGQGIKQLLEDEEDLSFVYESHDEVFKAYTGDEERLEVETKDGEGTVYTEFRAGVRNPVEKTGQEMTNILDQPVSVNELLYEVGNPSHNIGFSADFTGEDSHQVTALKSLGNNSEQQTAYRRVNGLRQAAQSQEELE